MKKFLSTLRYRPHVQFGIFSLTVLFLGMLATGLWLTSQIEKAVTSQAGAVTALYVDATIAPVTQTLRTGGELNEHTRKQLDHIFNDGVLKNEISAFKLWNSDNRVIYSTRPQFIGQVNDANPRLRQAQKGNVHAEMRGQLSWDTKYSGPQMEVYTPIWSERSDEVLAVAEFYSRTDDLMATLFISRIKAWIAVGSIFLVMFAILYGFFSRANRTIEKQKNQLDIKISELSALLDKNETLTETLNQANLRIAEINERSLRRVSAELHDGPAQLLAFAALRLDGKAGLESVSQAIDEALKDIRLICHGLVLPELENWSVRTICRRLAAASEDRYNQAVMLDMEDDIPPLNINSKNCIYRFVQETLNNAAHHAKDSTQKLKLHQRNGGIEIIVSDTGPGFDVNKPNDGLGLAGLKERINSLDGKFTLTTSIGGGTKVRLWLPAT
ncbi:sensor histidine kinase [Brucellaceae bacterium C25G]